MIKVSLMQSSSQGGGWAVAPLPWHAEYGKHYAFCTFEADFCTEIDNSPPLAFSICLFLWISRKFGHKNRTNF